MNYDYEYGEESENKCEFCGLKHNNFYNISLWKKYSQEEYDTVSCLSCILENNITVKNRGELLFEDDNLDINITDKEITVCAETIYGQTTHIFPIRKRTITETDPGESLNSAGPANRPQTYTDIQLLNKNATIEVNAPKKYISKEKFDYYYTSIKKYMDTVK